MLRENWYAVHVLSQYENKVKSYIDKVKKEHGYEDKVSEVVIPVDTEVKRVNGKKVEKKNKVFPGYILIRMKLDDDSYNFVRRVPGVDALSPEIGFVPKKKFSKDMLVRIVEGPFSEFTGKIETVYEEKEILKVMISLFGRDTPIEIEYSQVEKI
jgi:transcriptional antiterminator NusG